MCANYDSDDKHTPPILTPGQTGVHQRLEPQVSSFFIYATNNFFFQLDYMPVNYDGNDKYTPPIPKHG